MSVEEPSTEGYAMRYGTVWLNDVFVTREGRFRIFRRSSVRLSLVDVFWIAVSVVAAAALIVGVVRVLSSVPLLGDLVSYFFVLGALPAGWFTGRRIARASPYRRHSGEGLGAYLMVQSDKRGLILGRFVGRRVAVNRCVTWVSGKREVVECVEWLGTARAPLMPRHDPARGSEPMSVTTPPSCTPTPWVSEVRARRLALARLDERKPA